MLARNIIRDVKVEKPAVEKQDHLSEIVERLSKSRILATPSNEYVLPPGVTCLQVLLSQLLLRSFLSLTGEWGNVSKSSRYLLMLDPYLLPVSILI